MTGALPDTDIPTALITSLKPTKTVNESVITASNAVAVGLGARTKAAASAAAAPISAQS